MKLKFGNSVYKADLSNSIYQQSGADFGLTVNKGMLINNRPDGKTGIAQAAQKRAMKTAEKISIVARGTAMGEMMSDMSEDYS